jgi:GT2 family glycosyltransferase
MKHTAESILAVIPAWNSAEDLKTCLGSLLSLDYDKIRFVVADNNSSDHTETIVKEYSKSFAARGKALEYLKLDANYGPAGAMNRAVEKLYQEEDFILRIDSDIEINDREVLAKLVTFLRSRPEIGIVGPRMTVPDLNMDIVATFWIRPLGTIRNVALPEPAEVDLVNGGFVLIRGELYARLERLWSETLFYFWEELDISERARKLGYKTYYYPDAKLVHKIKTMGYKSERQIYYDFRNMLLVNWKFGTVVSRVSNFGVLFLPRLLYWILLRVRFRTKPIYHAVRDFFRLRKQYCAE